MSLGALIPAAEAAVDCEGEWAINVMLLSVLSHCWGLARRVAVVPRALRSGLFVSYNKSENIMKNINIF
jgi:hypothetical protein